MFTWLKSLFGKKRSCNDTTIEQKYTAAQEQLQAQEYALLQQEMIHPDLDELRKQHEERREREKQRQLDLQKRKQDFEVWIANCRNVDELFRRQNVTGKAA